MKAQSGSQMNGLLFIVQFSFCSVTLSAFLVFSPLMIMGDEVMMR